jgi:hypothetical protein
VQSFLSKELPDGERDQTIAQHTQHRKDSSSRESSKNSKIGIPNN